LFVGALLNFVTMMDLPFTHFFALLARGQQD